MEAISSVLILYLPSLKQALKFQLLELWMLKKLKKTINWRRVELE
jgi:hypothetical protein